MRKCLLGGISRLLQLHLFIPAFKAVFMIARSALGKLVNYKTGYTTGGHMEPSSRTYLYF